MVINGLPMPVDERMEVEDHSVFAIGGRAFPIRVALHAAGVHASTVQPEFVAPDVQARLEALGARVWIDTEQSEEDAWKNLDRAARRAGCAGSASPRK